MTDEFKNEFREVLQMQASEIEALQKRPKKGQALSNEEVSYLRQNLQGQALNSGRSTDEMQNARKWINAILKHYRLKERGASEKATLLLNPANFERWANDGFLNYDLSDQTQMELAEPDVEQLQSDKKSKFNFLGLEV